MSADLLAADARHVWHPYAPLPPTTAPLLVESASGVRLTLADGRELVDGMSSWWAAIHGYRHPVLDAAAQDQLGRMAHVMFGGLTHEPAIALARELVELTGLDHVFFSDSGSVAVEVALKMAVQHRTARGEPGRDRLLTVLGGYHGDTTGAMSLCDPIGGMHHLFRGVVTEQVFVSKPPAGPGVSAGWLAEVAAALEAEPICAVVVEPVVQGAGGMRFYDPAYVMALRRLCDEHGALLVLDEIATGFGRTGTMFAFEQAGVRPDILCVGKALTGGYLSMAATLCTAEVAATISGGPGGAFMHGPTFMANPLAASIARASIGLLRDGDWHADVARICGGLSAGLADLVGAPGVADVRVLGAIGVVQLDHEVDIAAASRAAVGQGVWLRPFRDLIYAMPPYVCTDEDVALITGAMAAAVRAAR